MRIGIGGERKGDLADYVISGFRKEDRKTVEDSILRAADAVICTVEKGIDIAMGEYNTKAKKKSAQEKKPERESAEIRDPDRRSAEEGRGESLVRSAETGGGMSGAEKRQRRIMRRRVYECFRDVRSHRRKYP